MVDFIPLQSEFRQELPEVLENLDDATFRVTLKRMEEVIELGKLGRGMASCCSGSGSGDGFRQQPASGGAEEGGDSGLEVIPGAGTRGAEITEEKSQAA